jgi:hypothetical protein
MLATELCWSSLKNPRNWSWSALTWCICVCVCVCVCAVCSSSSSNFTNLSTLCGFLTHQVHHQIKVAHCKQIIFQIAKIIIIIKFLLPISLSSSWSNSLLPTNVFQIPHKKFFICQCFSKFIIKNSLLPMFFKFIIKNSLFTNVFQIHHQILWIYKCFSNSSSKILYLPMSFKFIINFFTYQCFSNSSSKILYYQFFSNSSLNPWSEFWWSISFNYYLSSDLKVF